MKSLKVQLLCSWVVPALLAFAGIGCGSGLDSTTSPETVSEIGTATVSGSVNSGTSGGAMAFNRSRNTGWMNAIASRLSFLPDAWAATTCPSPVTGVAGSNCSVDPSGKIMTLAYSSCNFGNNSAVWNGTQLLTSSAAVACGTFPSEANGATLGLTFGSGTTRTIGNSVHVTTIDTATSSGYNAPVSGGAVISFTGASSRTIAISGIHLTAIKSFKGKNGDAKTQTVWDHTINTSTGAPLTVAVSGSDKTVNGTLVVQHNLEKYTGTLTFQSVVYSAAAGCCHPVSGSVTTTLSGSKTGTETLTFSGSSTCGASTLVDSGGVSSSLTLTHCL